MIGGFTQTKQIIQRRQMERNLEGLLQRIGNVRAISTGRTDQQRPLTLNPRKRQMIMQDKNTEIERQNKCLLQKIANTYNKSTMRRSSYTQRDNPNRTLNTPFRKKVNQQIDTENARILKNMQELKSDYEAFKLKQEWKKRKEVIKNIANYPLILNDGSRKQKRKLTPKTADDNESINPNQLQGKIQMIRLRNVDGVNLIITVRIGKKFMRIIGDSKLGKTIKIIQVPRKEAFQFIHKQCEGKILKIFERVHFDQVSNILYLLGKQAEHNFKNMIDRINPLPESIKEDKVGEDTINND